MSLRRKLLFSVIPLLVMLLMGEVGARVAGAPVCEAVEPRATGWDTMIGDPRYLWRLEPGRVFESPAGTTRFNGAGLRTALEPTDPKEPGEIRVAVTGDSSIYGWGQPEGSTYAEQLERLLDRGIPGHVVHVVNLGVPGYSTEQTIRLLEDVGWRYRPDLVVVHNIFSDCNIDAFQDRAALALANPEDTPGWKLLHRSRLYCALYMPWARYQAGLNQHVNRVLMPGNPVGPNAAARLEAIDRVIDLSRVPLHDYLQNLDRILDEARRHSASMIVAPLAQEWDVGLWRVDMPRPTPDRVLPWTPYRKALAKWADRRGIGIVQLPEAFAAAPGNPEALFIDHMHPSVRGAAVMARAVAAHLWRHPELLGLAPADISPPPATPLPDVSGPGPLRPGHPPPRAPAPRR